MKLFQFITIIITIVLCISSLAVASIPEKDLRERFHDREVAHPIRARLSDLGHRISLEDEEVFMEKNILYSKQQTNFDGHGANYKYEIQSNFDIYSPDEEKSGVMDMFWERGSHFLRFSHAEKLAEALEMVREGNVLFSAVNWERSANHSPHFWQIISSYSIFNETILQVRTKEITLNDAVRHYKIQIENIDPSVFPSQFNGKERVTHSIVNSALSFNYDPEYQSAIFPLSIYDGYYGSITCENCYFTSYVKFSIIVDDKSSYAKVTITDGEINLGWRYEAPEYGFDYSDRFQILSVDVLKLIPVTRIISIAIGIGGGLSSTIEVSAQAQFAVTQNSNFQFSGSFATNNEQSTSFSFVPDIDKPLLEVDASLDIKLSLGPTFTFSISLIGEISTYVDPYAEVLFELQPDCDIIPVYYSTYVGLDVSAEAELLFGYFTSEFSTNIVNKPLNCDVCSGCLFVSNNKSPTTPTPVAIPSASPSPSVLPSTTRSPTPAATRNFQTSQSPTATRSRTPSPTPSISISPSAFASIVPSQSPIPITSLSASTLPSVPDARLINLFEQVDVPLDGSSVITLQLNTIDYEAYSAYSSQLAFQFYNSDNISQIEISFGALYNNNFYDGLIYDIIYTDQQYVIYVVDLGRISYYYSLGASPSYISLYSSRATDVLLYTFLYDFKGDLGFTFSIESMKAGEYVEYQYSYNLQFSAIAVQCIAESGDIDLLVSTSNGLSAFESQSNEIGFVINNSNDITITLVPYTDVGNLECIFAGIFYIPTGSQYSIFFNNAADQYIFYYFEVGYLTKRIEIFTNNGIEILFSFVDLASDQYPLDTSSAQYSSISSLQVDLTGVSVSGFYPVIALPGNSKILTINQWRTVANLETLTDSLGSGSSWAHYYNYITSSAFNGDSVLSVYLYTNFVDLSGFTLTNSNGEVISTSESEALYYNDNGYFVITVNSSFVAANSEIEIKVFTTNLYASVVYSLYIEEAIFLRAGESISGVVSSDLSVVYYFEIPSDWDGVNFILTAEEGNPDLTTISNSVTYQSSFNGNDSLGVYNQGTSLVQILVTNSGSYTLTNEKLNPTTLELTSPLPSLSAIQSGQFNFSIIITNPQYQFTTSVAYSIDGLSDLVYSISSYEMAWSRYIVPAIAQNFTANVKLITKQEYLVTVPAIPNLVLSRDLCIRISLNSYDILPFTDGLTASLTISSGTGVGCFVPSSSPSPSKSRISSSPSRTRSPHPSFVHSSPSSSRTPTRKPSRTSTPEFRSRDSFSSSSSSSTSSTLLVSLCMTLLFSVCACFI